METEERYTGLVTTLESIQKSLTRNKKTEREIKQYYNNIEEEKNKIEKVASEIEKMQQLLPSEVSDAENISLLRSMAEEINILIQKAYKNFQDQKEDVAIDILKQIYCQN
jgi:hypothetical protein